MKQGMVRFISISSFLVLLAACQGDEQKKKLQENVVVASIEKPITRLYFSGVLQPVKTIPVITPVDGRVEEIQFDYGKNVTKDQVMVVLSSTQLGEQYQQAVTDYLQKKQAYTNSIESYQASIALYKAGVSARETFILDKTQYENNVLSYFQAKYKLEDILRKVNVDPKSIEKLTLSNTASIHEILQRRFGRTEVKSPGTGVALFPLPDSGSDDKKGGKLRVGNEVKAGQVLLSIGDMSGLSSQVQVSEISIVRMKTGMPVVITGDSFPGITFKGLVTSVSTQANPEQGGGGGSALSMFNVDLKVSKITPEESKAIRVGMTAKIEISIEEKPQIVLPVKAVWNRDAETFVTIIDASGKRKDVTVVTGTTTPTGVTIISGVKEGDRVVVK